MARMMTRHGFTLIELSIVLVIIGLIVGGVLVGQDLIKAAELRATLGQYEKYGAAVNTFRTKFNGIPGDLEYSKATAFGLFSMTGASPVGGLGSGDGNGQIQDNIIPGGQYARGETLVFWRQLSDAGLVDGSYGSTLTAAGAADADTSEATVGQYLPAAKVGRGNYWSVATGGGTGKTFLVLAGFSGSPFDAATGNYHFGVALTPIEAYNLDAKLDDGLPNTGTVQARSAGVSVAAFSDVSSSLSNYSAFHTTVQGSSPGDCMIGASATNTANTYARIAEVGTAPGCVLRFRFN